MSDQCTRCKCDFGHVKCEQIQCPVLKCEVKKMLADQCCPICTGECFDGQRLKYYQPNETWFHNNDDCISCKCIDGVKSCLTESCAPSPCATPVKTPGVCCSSCERASATCEEKCRDLKCEYGYVMDQYGCDMCKCVNRLLDDISTKLLNKTGEPFNILKNS